MAGRDRYLGGYASQAGGDRERRKVAEPPAIFRNPWAAGSLPSLSGPIFQDRMDGTNMGLIAFD